MKNKEEVYKITAILLMIDQIIKLWVNHFMNLYDEIKVIPHFFSIHYVKNTGAAFSILEDSTILLTIISVIVIVFLHKIIKEEKNLSKQKILSYGCILGGIFGNLIDRIIHHGVIDYLSFQFGKYDFPIFNFADISIVCGVLFMIFILLREKEPGDQHEHNRNIQKVLSKRKSRTHKKNQ